MAASGVAFGQSDGRPNAKKVCRFNIAGIWRSDVTTESTPIYFDFSPEGHVTLLGHSADTLPQDFEVITSVSYKLDKPAEPKSIEFTAHRGNDVFPPGVTSLKVTEYSDNSFTTLDPVSKQQTRWVREQTHLYFLTFAVRSGQLPLEGHAFVMWTVLDGRKTETEALGVQPIKDEAGKIQQVFGPVPPEIYNQVAEDGDKDKKSNKDESVFMRLELNEAEFQISHDLYQTWDRYAKARSLPNADPYMNAVEFLKRVAESLNQCEEKVKLLALSQREEIISKNNLPQFLLEYVKVMRKKNDELHVSNRVFPWGWRPALQLRGQ
jgi:hypothetical protein